MRSRRLAVIGLLAVPISAHATAGDVRVDLPAGNTDLRAAHPVGAANPGAVDGLRANLGRDGVVSVDARNGALRMVGRLDGFLTQPSEQDAAGVALDYVRANRSAFGLTEADIDNLVLVRRVTSVDGLQRLFWQQRSGGVPALESGLRANVTADGRLINVEGSPVSGIAGTSVAPRLSAGQARVEALAGVGVAPLPSLARAGTGVRSTTTFASGDQAALGVLAGATKRAVWDTTVTVDGSHVYRAVVDATTGATLLRRNLVQAANASVYRNYPGAPVGGTASAISLDSWLTAPGTTLTGPNVHAYSDVDDNNVAGAGEDIGPSAGTDFNYPLGGAFTGTGCSASFLCSWNPSVANSWTTNRSQNATQAFFFVNNFHDWLKTAPIGFTAANGNFEVTDPVQANTDDGAAGPGGVPDGNHTSNADMFTPPDGTSPRMQMYLFRSPFIASNGGDDAGVVYHEYTHGLSNRLVVDSLGNSTLSSAQADSMGEGWSDWYAMDYLVDPATCGCETDTGASGEVLVGKYVSVNTALIRWQAIDCAVGAATALCASPRTGVPAGGFTYASFGKINGSPEVHADGEIWAQTLWDLRTAIGAPLARNLITRAMELSPDDPSFLDMRNAILQADTAVNGGLAHNQIWAVFAARGMGYFAGSLDAADTAPVASFALPPAAGSGTGTLSGHVVDLDTHAPVSGARVSFAGLDSGFGGNAGATAAVTGVFTLPALPIGPYPYLVAGGVAGYERSVVTPFALAAGASVADLTPRRGWALASGGGAIDSFTGFDNTSVGCGPADMIDGSLGRGWVGNPGNRITVKLPTAITVRSFALDPHTMCSLSSAATARDIQIETSPDNITFTIAALKTFGIADAGKLNEILPTAGTTNVRYVRVTAINNTGGGSFVSIAEFSVHGVEPGVATAAIAGPATIQLGATAVFISAASTGPGGSPIVSQTWTRTGAPNAATPTYALKGTTRGAKLTMTLAVTDFAGRTGATSKTITVVDTLGPVATLRKASGKINKNVTISGNLVDPSGLAKTASVRFGDGKSATATLRDGKFSVQHKFKKAKTFTITVTVKDKLRNTSRTTSKVVIRKR